MKYLLFFLISISLISCVSKEREKELLTRISELEVQLDECENGAEKLIGKVEKAYSEKNYSLARKNIELLYERHPESPKNEEFKKLLLVIKEEELKEKKRLEEEKKERIRLANLNNTGMWSVRYYVDKFGEPTKQAYITNINKISGVFSNTATQDSRLNVDFLITNSNNISIKLFEYAGNNPVKAYSSENYNVLIQDNDGKRFEMPAINYSDRLTFNETNSRKIHNILIKGGLIKFRIYEIDTPTTHYEFNINNADWYENAYQKLKES